MQTVTTDPAAASPDHSSLKSVYIIDDHPLFRDGLAKCLDDEADLTLAGQAGSLDAALADRDFSGCNLVVLDLSLGTEDGMSCLRRLRLVRPEVRILVMSMHEERQYALPSLRAGAHGYLSKRADPESFLEALRSIAEGQVYVSDSFRSQLIYRVLSPTFPGEDPLQILTERELQVLTLVGEGYSTVRLAALLGLSVKTVESHRLHLKEKLELPSAAELVKFAADWVGYKAKGAGAVAAG